MRRGIALLLIAAGLLAAGGCERLHGPRPDILLVTIDTLRADRLGAYGRPEAGTPVFDRLAREGILFEAASAQVPLTLPSHASILTGRDPTSHRVRDNTAFRLDEGERTLAELLSEAGYRTGAVLGAVVLNRRFGLAQGFEHYDDVPVSARRGPEHHVRRADQVTERALGWLARLDRGDRQPLFLWVHYFDPHEPYAPPEPHRSRFPRDPYQGEVAFSDEALGVLLRGLAAARPGRQTVVVVTSDHGEGLGEHGEPTHGFFLYESTLHVPLVWWSPGLLPAGRRIAAPVRSIDLLPTLAELLRIPAPPGVEGASLLPSLSGEPPDPNLASYSESLAGHLAFGLSPLRALRLGEWKYVLAPEPELYRLSDDPGELRNRVSEEPERAAALRARLIERVRSAAAQAAPAAAAAGDEIFEEQLRSLGYVVAGSLPDELSRLDREPEPRGPDPKQARALIRHVIAAERLRGIGQVERAEEELRAALRLDPDNQHALTYLAKLYEQQGRIEEAVALLAPRERELRVTRAQQVLGKLYLRQGRWEAALRVFESLARREPHNVWAHYYAAQALQRLGREEAAAAALRRALRAEPALVDAHLELARLELRAGRPEAARDVLRGALDRAPGSPEVRELLGLALLRMGEVEPALRETRPLLQRRRRSVALLVVHAADAVRRGQLDDGEALLQRALERDPQSPDAWYALAWAEAERGRPEAALAALERALSAPGGAAYRALLSEQPAFQRLAEDPRFRALLAERG